MNEDKTIYKLRREILGGRKLQLTTDPDKYEQADTYYKSPKMKYIETKYKLHLEAVIFRGSLLDICKLLNWEVDRSTVSRWRKHIQSYIGKVVYRD